MNKKMIDCIEEALSFWDIAPVEVEQNVGTVWFKNANTGKGFCLSITETDGGEDDD